VTNHHYDSIGGTLDGIAENQTVINDERNQRKIWHDYIITKEERDEFDN
jgi:hypothetical protein